MRHTVGAQARFALQGFPAGQLAVEAEIFEIVVQNADQRGLVTLGDQRARLVKVPLQGLVIGEGVRRGRWRIAPNFC